MDPKQQVQSPFPLVDYSSEEGEGNAGSHTDLTESTTIQPMGDLAKPSKPALFARIFGEEDEVAILQGMDDYRKTTGGDPTAESDAFFEFLMKTLKIDVTKGQLMDKVRRLKKRYQHYLKKGEDRVVSSKPHKLKLFELSKKVWTGEAAVQSGKRKVRVGAKIGKKKQKVSMGLVSVNENVGLAEDELELVDKVTTDPEGFWNAYPYFKDALEVENSEFFPKRMVEYSKIGAAKAMEMEVEWRELRAKESEIKSSKLELVKKQTDLFRDVVKP